MIARPFPNRETLESERDYRQKVGQNQRFRDRVDAPSRVKRASVGPREHMGTTRHNGEPTLTAADYQTYESIVDLALHHAGLPYGFDADDEQGGGLV